MTVTSGGPQGIRALGRIGLWGAPTCGKTTFLAALNIAVSQAAAQELMIFGVDDASTDFLVDNTAKLTSERKFPAGTIYSGNQYSWVLRMETQVPERRRFGRQTMTTVPLEMNLDLMDEPGRVFKDVQREPDPAAPGGGGQNLGFDDDDDDGDIDADSDAGTVVTEDSVMDQLASCDGLLLLFDPTREWTEGDAFNHFQGTLLRIAQRRMAGQTVPGGRLPQYVAVCATKFDHPDVYRRAKNGGYRRFAADDPAMFPQVADELAEKFFADLVRQSERGNADLVAMALRRYFEPDRVRFFITSAIGFYKSRRSARFQEADFMNTVRQADGTYQIRGAVHPINVVEPLVWLGQSLAAR
jgi:hypothetical protein